MPENKFRVWCKNKKEWENDYTFLNDTGTLFHQNESGWTMPLNDATHIVDRCIGRKANGKTIFEGDILSSFIDPEIILKHVVEWSDKYLGWYLWNIKDVNKTGDGSVQAFVYFNNTGKDCEIIGNIHENCLCGKDKSPTWLDGQEVCMNCTKNIIG